MTTSSTMGLDDVIEELRNARGAAGPTPTTQQVRLLLDDIWAMRHIAATAARPELSGFSELDLISIAELFGKHRARVLKQALQGKRVRHDAIASGMLFPPSEDEVRQARELFQSGVRPYKADKHGTMRRNLQFPKQLLPAAEVAEQEWGVLPGGYDREAGHGRDVHVSLAAVLAKPVEDAEIIRFVDRTYSGPAVVLDADHVRLLHWLVSHGLGFKLLELAARKAVTSEDGKVVIETTDAAGNETLSKLMVQAYDLLDVARADAVRALGRVVRGMVSGVAETRQALMTARWLAPGHIGRLIQLGERALAAPGNDRLQQIFASAIRTFAMAVKSNPQAYVVRDVASLTDAHIAQILTLSGLSVDDEEEKSASNVLRTRLVEMGLRNDLDRELPEALRAWRGGRLEEFFASRQARLEGDPDWVRHYEPDLDSEALAATAATV